MHPTLANYKHPKIITVVRVRCICEPRGAHGLEGFLLGDGYEAQIDPSNSVALHSLPENTFTGEKEFLGRTSIAIADRYFERVDYR